MATYIKDLKEDNGDIVYPHTNTDAVYTSGGETLETRISKYVTAEDVATSVQSFGTVTVGMLDWSGIMDKIYPVGSIYMSATLTTPAAVATALGGTWVAWGSGRVPVGVDTNDTDFDAAEATGGEKTHTLTVSEMPSHTHKSRAHYGTTSPATSVLEWWSTSSTDYSYYAISDSVGGDQSHNNLQPYITCYMYKRTA